MKSKKELDEIKEEVEKLDAKLHELTEEELEQVTGGIKTVDFGKPVVDFSVKFDLGGGQCSVLGGDITDNMN